MDSVKEVYEQTLMETVAGALALKRRSQWPDDDVKKAFSPESLTASCMNRYHQINNIKRLIGSKIKQVVESEDD